MTKDNEVTGNGNNREQQAMIIIVSGVDAGGRNCDDKDDADDNDSDGSDHGDNGDDNDDYEEDDVMTMVMMVV